MEYLSVRNLVILTVLMPLAYWTYVGLKAWKSKPEGTPEDSNENNQVDFSSIPAAPGKTPPKPVDFSGNYIQHAQETLDEDLENLGLEKNPITKIQKEED